MYPSLSNDSIIDVLRLIRTQNVGPITFFQLMMRFGSAAEALAQLPHISVRGGRKEAIAPFSRTLAEQEIEAVNRLGARMIRYGEADYPQWLSYIPDAPPIITVLGRPGVWQQAPALAMVGSRNASANGCQWAQKLARECGTNGLVIISGLARGIDSFAHRGSLATGTVAVVAGGIDHIYPPENEGLYREIAAQGAIISDQPFGQVPFASSFPSRNRIIAGMAQATLVVEASPKSGSLITARMALDYNREVMAVPGSPIDPRAKGCNQLIKQGAIMVEDANDVIQHLSRLGVSSASETSAETYVHTPISEQDIDQARGKILEKLGHTATGVDELVEQCNISAGVVQAVLLELELAGRLKRGIGNKVSLTFLDEQDVA